MTDTENGNIEAEGASPRALSRLKESDRRYLVSARRHDQLINIYATSIRDFVGVASTHLQQQSVSLPRNPIRFLFLLLVIVPTLLAILYYGFIASDQFVSEMRLTVRSGDSQRNDATGLFQGMAAASQIGLDSNIIVQYLQSREIVDAVDQKIHLREMFSKSGIDFFSRIKRSASIEELVDYWKSKVDVFFDMTTGIISVKVKSFTSRDSQTIGKEIIDHSEAFVNALSQRSREDYLRAARQQLDEAATRLLRAREEILQYRNKKSILDPKKEADSTLDLLKKLKEELAQSITNFNTNSSYMQESAPTLRAQGNRIAALRAQIAVVESNLTNSKSSETKVLSSEIQSFEPLETERQLAEKYYEMTLMSFQKAQFESIRQNIYVSVIVRPTLAQDALYPRRMVNIFLTMLCGFGIWLFLILSYRSVKEHI